MKVTRCDLIKALYYDRFPNVVSGTVVLVGSSLIGAKH